MAASPRRTMANGDAMFEPEFSLGTVVEVVAVGAELLSVVLEPEDHIMISRRNWQRGTRALT
jgi:hypothetical protein